MNIYTKSGDRGTTNLIKGSNISKSDERIELLGTIDELSSNLGLTKALEKTESIIKELEYIQKNLMLIMSSVADPGNHSYQLSEEAVFHIELEINRMEQAFPRKKEFVLPGSSLLSSYYDIGRTIARRAERVMIKVDRRYGMDATAKAYMNRLSDFLYIVARYTDYLGQTGGMNGHQGETRVGEENHRAYDNSKNTTTLVEESLETKIVKEVLKRIGMQKVKLNLELTKKLIEQIELEAEQMGLHAVIAICGAEGHPIAVHVMDDAYLASYDIAMKKAYTSVAVKMSTEKLGHLSLPGETFYGIDKADQGRIIIIGGGEPLLISGQMLGGLGISGGTSQEDATLAKRGFELFQELIKNNKS